MNNKKELKEEDRQKCEVWTRVMGYHRPVDQFNKGKKSEYEERVFYSENKCLNDSEVKDVG